MNCIQHFIRFEDQDHSVIIVFVFIHHSIDNNELKKKRKYIDFEKRKIILISQKKKDKI